MVSLPLRAGLQRAGSPENRRDVYNSDAQPARSVYSRGAALPAVRLLLVEDGRCDRADAFGVADRVDLGDLALGDGEAHYGDGLPAGGHVFLTNVHVRFTANGVPYTARDVN